MGLWLGLRLPATLEAGRSAVLETAFGDAQRPAGGMLVWVQEVSRVPFGFGAHRRARELVVQVRREGPAAADRHVGAVGSSLEVQGREFEHGRSGSGRPAHRDANGSGTAKGVAGETLSRASRRSARRRDFNRFGVVRGKAPRSLVPGV